MSGRWGRASVVVAAGAALWIGAASASGRPELLLLSDAATTGLVDGAALPGVGPLRWTVVPGGEIAARACAGGGSWVAVAATGTWRLPRGSCLSSGTVEHATMAIGREAAVLVTRRGGTPLALDRRQVHRAIAASIAGAPNSAQSWREIGSGLPDTQIRMLLPPAGSSLWQVFAGGVLEAGCLSEPEFRRAFDAADRQARCTALRGDGRVVRSESAFDRAAWLADQPDGAVAVLSYSELLRAGSTVVVVPIDGERPTFATLASGSYAASRTVYATIGYRADGTGRAGFAATAMAVVAEESIGPSGVLAARGLVPLPAAERVALRERVLELAGAL